MCVRIDPSRQNDRCLQSFLLAVLSETVPPWRWTQDGTMLIQAHSFDSLSSSAVRQRRVRTLAPETLPVFPSIVRYLEFNLLRHSCIDRMNPRTVPQSVVQQVIDGSRQASGKPETASVDVLSSRCFSGLRTLGDELLSSIVAPRDSLCSRFSLTGLAAARNSGLHRPTAAIE
jgi:hypothetical protein